MRSSRAATILAAFLVATAGLAIPPAAAAEAVVTNLAAPSQALGPNAGYLGRSEGESGRTALFRVTVPSTSATISTASLTILDEDGRMSVSADLDSRDGLALYAEHDGQANFGAADLARGPLTNGFAVTGMQAGAFTVRLTVTSPISGYVTYYVVMHPSSRTRADQRLVVGVPAGGIAGSFGTGPADAVATPPRASAADDRRIVIRTQRPAALSATRFAPEVNPAGTEDAYAVDVSALPAAVYSSANIVFFNAPGTRNESALLRRPGPGGAGTVPVVHPVLPADGARIHRVAIGDGTGITATRRVAQNNQLSNAVYAAILDDAGNVSDPVLLSQCYRSTETSQCDAVRRGNPVVGPVGPTGIVWGSGPPGFTGIAGINRRNSAAVPVQVENPPGARTVPPGENLDTAPSAADGGVVQIAQLDDAGKVTAQVGPPAAVAAADWDATVVTSANSNATTAGDVEYAGVADGARAVASAVAIDVHGNTSDRVVTTSIRKDVTPPTMSVTTSTSATAPSRGDVYRVQFSESMNTLSVEDSTTFTPGLQGTKDERCAAQDPESGVDERLPARGATSQTNDRTWGIDPCFHWSADGSSATLMLGGDVVGGPTLAFLGDEVVPAGEVDDPVVRDLVGNQLVGNPAVPTAVGEVPITATGPYPTGAVTVDGDTDGALEAIDVTFTAAIDGSNFDAVKSAFVIDAGLDAQDAVPVAAMSLVGDGTVVRFSFDEVFLSGVRPSVRLVQEGPDPVPFRAAGGSHLVAPFSVRALDKAAPRPVDAYYTDEAPADGRIDTLRVRYSEPIEHALDNNAGYRAAPYVVTSVQPTGDRSDTKIIRVAAPMSTGTPPPDTGVSLTLRYAALSWDENAPGAPYDAPPPDGNRMSCPTGRIDPCYEVAVRDAARPFPVARQTRDTDLDGKVDAIDVVFSEPLSTLSVLNSQFSVQGRQLTDLLPFGNNTVRLVIEELGGLDGDTDAAPGVTYVGGVRDTDGNEATAASLTVDDAAGPAMAAACVRSASAGATAYCPSGGDGTLVQVALSEPVETGSVSASDFVIEQPAGRLVVPASATVSTSGEIVNLTVAAGQLTSAHDAFVRLAAAGALRDRRASSPNGSAQVNPVTAFGNPGVTLSLSCPAPAPPGYCGGRTVNVSAVGTSGIVEWRLATAPGGSEPPATDFTGSIPVSFTLPSEGRHTLFLTGKDVYGRVSPEVSRLVTILDTPSITNVALVNNATRPGRSWSPTTTVRDGDQVRVTASANGADAPDWTAANGGCLARHMSIDIRALSGLATDGAVPPSSCPLASSTRRAMEFGFRQVTNTTRYPVGTVLKTTASDPGYLIVDGPGGTQLRRRFVSVGARQSWAITDASVIRVPAAVLTPIKRGTAVYYREGALLRAPNGFHYVMSDGKRHWASRTTLSYWRMPLTTAYAITTSEFDAIPPAPSFGKGAHPVGVWIKFSTGAIHQVTRDAAGRVVRRPLAGAAALRTLVPSSHVYPANSYDLRIPVDSWLRGYRDGVMLKFADGSYGVVARASLRRFANAETFNTLGYNASNAVAASSAAMPRASGGSYRTGAVIDRYKIDSVVVTVRNSAGTTARATVLPAIGGVYGVGTSDPVPQGWDFTR